VHLKTISHDNSMITSLPIQIKNRNKTAQSPSQSPSCNYSPPKLRRVTLLGGPFKNEETVRSLLRLCVPELSQERIGEVVQECQAKRMAHVITCPETKAHQYVVNLVENGLYADVEDLTK